MVKVLHKGFEVYLSYAEKIDNFPQVIAIHTLPRKLKLEHSSPISVHIDLNSCKDATA